MYVIRVLRELDDAIIVVKNRSFLMLFEK